VIVLACLNLVMLKKMINMVDEGLFKLCIFRLASSLHGFDYLFLGVGRNIVIYGA